MNLSSPPLEAIESVRAELQVLDAALVAELLCEPAGQGGESAVDSCGPFALLSQRVPGIGRMIQSACERPLLESWGQDGRSAAAGLLRARIAIGASVAEVKHQSAPERFTDALRRRDADALLERITYPDIEQRVVERAMTLAVATGFPERADRIGTLFRELVIPLTKQVQVAVLLHGGGAE